MAPGQRAGTGKAAAGFRSSEPLAGWYGEGLLEVLADWGGRWHRWS